MVTGGGNSSYRTEQLAVGLPPPRNRVSCLRLLQCVDLNVDCSCLSWAGIIVLFLIRTSEMLRCTTTASSFAVPISPLCLIKHHALALTQEAPVLLHAV